MYNISQINTHTNLSKYVYTYIQGCIPRAPQTCAVLFSSHIYYLGAR